MTAVPKRAPVIVLAATPLAAVAVPVLTVPAPDCLAKLTTVVLSAVTVFPAASWIVAFSTRVAPEVRVAVEPVSGNLGRGTVDDGEGAEHTGREPGGGCLHDEGSEQCAGDGLGRDAALRRGGPVPVTVPSPDCLVKLTRWCCRSDCVAGGVLDCRSQVPSPQKVRLAVEPVRAIWAAAPDRALRHRWRARGRGFDHDGPTRRRDRLGRDAAAAVVVLVPVTVPAPDCFAKVTTVVLPPVTCCGPCPGSLQPAPASPRGEVRSRAGEGDLSRGAVDDGEDPSTPVVSRVAVACMTMGPTGAPVSSCCDAAVAVAVRVPVMVPAPDCLVKLTTVVLSDVTVLPAASWIVAVRTRVAPEVRSVVAPLKAI